jgi:hypothetical protein
MLKGIYLSLMVGPAVPVIAPKEVMDDLTSISVKESKESSGFQLVFNIGKNSLIQKALLPAGYFDPIVTRVILIATVKGIPHVLMDGLVTNHELGPSSEAGKSTLTITGEDLSLAMDLVSKTVPFPGMPEVAIINLLLAPYAALGIIPLVIPPIISTVKMPNEGFISQISTTDRSFIRSMARSCGYVFFVQPGPLPAQSIAYFGPDVSLPIPQPALTFNMDAETNVESLSFSLDGLAKAIRVFTILDPFTMKVPVPVPIPNVNVFKPPLGLKPPIPAKIEFDAEGSQLSPSEAAKAILGFMMNNPAAVSCSGSLNVTRYGTLLKSRMVVGVRGSGITYDGLYYVDSVTHSIKHGEYKQNFTLSRDGLISNTPFIRP